MVVEQDTSIPSIDCTVTCEELLSFVLRLRVEHANKISFIIILVHFVAFIVDDEHAQGIIASGEIILSHVRPSAIDSSLTWLGLCRMDQHPAFLHTK